MVFELYNCKNKTLKPFRKKVCYRAFTISEKRPLFIIEYNLHTIVDYRLEYAVN